MTIGAGVLATDGIVLAADSQETLDDYLKLFKPKVIELTIGSAQLKCVVVGSGDGPFIDMLTERIASLLGVVEPYLENAKDTVHQSILDVCHQIFPLYPTQESRPQAHLLIGIWASDGLALLDSIVPMIKTAEEHTFIGFGRDLAAYKAKQLMPPQMPLSVAVPLTAHILDIAKNNVEHCGGETKMVVIKRDGTVEKTQLSFIKNAETGYERASWFLESIAFPILPTALGDDGRDILTMIGDLGKLSTEKREETAASLSKLLNIPRGSGKAAFTDDATSAALILWFTLTMIRDSAVPKLVLSGVISEEEREKLKHLINIPALMSKSAYFLIHEGKMDEAKKFLASAVKVFGVIANNSS
ncbi:MAG: hypothetical protein ABSD59_24340 [Terracidiphilus sp.]